MSNRDAFRRKFYQAGAVIFRYGDRGGNAFFVESGRIDICRHDRNGMRLLGVVEKGGVFGEMALIDGQPRMADAICREDASLIVIGEAEFQKKLSASDPFIVGLLRVFVRDIRRLNDQIGEPFAPRSQPSDQRRS